MGLVGLDPATGGHHVPMAFPRKADAPYPTIAGMPAPGIERRRALRAAGINIKISDFTEAEQRHRGFWQSRDDAAGRQLIGDQ